MGLVFRKKVNPNVNYAGKTLPKDKVPYQPTPVDPNVEYAGAILPKDKIDPSPVIKDLTNNPSLIKLGVVTLPEDTIIYVNGSKMLAESKILDGVSVFERIQRNPFEIEFECVVRQKDEKGNYIFPQALLNDIFERAFYPSTVLEVENTYLNRLGIFQVIVDQITPSTVRGSTNIPLRIHCYENVPGQTIIIQ